MTCTSWSEEYAFCSRRLSAGGYGYHYVDEGEGPPLLMVHGNPTWSFYWRHLISAFRDRFRVIAPDHMGCGLSDKPANYNYSLETHIRNLARLAEQLDLNNVTLIGHDWGGAIGMGAAVRLPRRFSRFILLNTAAFPPPFFPWRIRVCRTPLLGRLAVQGLNLFSRAALRMAVHRPAALSRAFKSGIVAPYDSWGNRVGIYSFVKDIPQSPRHPTWQTLADIESRLPRFANHPVCLIWGMRDWCFRPSCLDRFAKIFPQATVHRIEDAGHWVAEEARDEVKAHVAAFLDQHGNQADAIALEPAAEP